jgi:hypothetical protein
MAVSVAPVHRDATVDREPLVARLVAAGRIAADAPPAAHRLAQDAKKVVALQEQTGAVGP